MHSDASTEAAAQWLSSLYDVELELFNMEAAIEALPSVKFERRREKQKLPAFLHVYWKIMAQFIERVWVTPTSEVCIASPHL
jgi:midasin